MLINQFQANILLLILLKISEFLLSSDICGGYGKDYWPEMENESHVCFFLIKLSVRLPDF